MSGGDDAVSPVVGSILMVVVVVALAGMTVLLTDSMVEEPHVAPSLTFRIHGSEQTLTVIRAPLQEDWADIDVQGCTGWTPLTGQITAGDRIGPCEPGDDVRIIHVPTGTLLFTYGFP